MERNAETLQGEVDDNAEYDDGEPRKDPLHEHHPTSSRGSGSSHQQGSAGQPNQSAEPDSQPQDQPERSPPGVPCECVECKKLATKDRPAGVESECCGRVHIHLFHICPECTPPSSTTKITPDTAKVKQNRFAGNATANTGNT